MRHLQKFENYDKVYTLDELYPIEKWMESIWEDLGEDERKLECFLIN